MNDYIAARCAMLLSRNRYRDWLRANPRVENNPLWQDFTEAVQYWRLCEEELIARYAHICVFENEYGTQTVRCQATDDCDEYNPNSTFATSDCGCCGRWVDQFGDEIGYDW